MISMDRLALEQLYVQNHSAFRQMYFIVLDYHLVDR